MLKNMQRIESTRASSMSRSERQALKGVAETETKPIINCPRIIASSPPLESNSPPDTPPTHLSSSNMGNLLTHKSHSPGTTATTTTTKNDNATSPPPNNAPAKATTCLPSPLSAKSAANSPASFASSGFLRRKRTSSVLGEPFADVQDKYVLQRVLGRGHFGEVRRAMEKNTKRRVAVKSVLKARLLRGKNEEQRARELQRVVNEVNVLREASRSSGHPNIVELVEVMEDETHIHLVMELCTGGDLFSQIVKGNEDASVVSAFFNEGRVRRILRELLSAVEWLHARGITHRDIKPENILFLAPEMDSPVKLCDFGLAEFLSPADETFLKERVGTVYYIAPEVVKGSYDEKCDIWSLGCVFFVMLAGSPPFYADTVKGVFEAILTGELTFPPRCHRMSASVKACIATMLMKDPAKRPSATECLEELPWLKGETVDEMLATEESLHTLRAFHKLSAFKKAAMHVVAENLSAKEINRLETAFRTMDLNGDGVLSMDELRECFRHFRRRTTSSLAEVTDVPSVAVTTTTGEEENDHDDDDDDDLATIRAIFDSIDSNGNMRIEFDEFLAAATARRDFLKHERLLKAFAYFDRNGNGKISKEELRECLGDAADEKMLEEIVALADENGDGEIDVLEFMNAMTNGM